MVRFFLSRINCEYDGIMTNDDVPLFDLRPAQTEIQLYKVRFDPATAVRSTTNAATPEVKAHAGVT